MKSRRRHALRILLLSLSALAAVLLLPGPVSGHLRRGLEAVVVPVPGGLEVSVPSACVKAGWLGHHVVLVPARGVTASPDHLTVTVTKDVAEKAPAMEPDGELSAEVEERLFVYYAIDYRPAQSPGGRRLVRR